MVHFLDIASLLLFSHISLVAADSARAPSAKMAMVARLSGRASLTCSGDECKLYDI